MYCRLKHFLLILFIFLGTGIIRSQTIRLASEEYPEHKYYPLRGEVYTNQYIQVKGNAYLTEDWTEGTIYLTGNESITGVKFKYDVFAQTVLVYNDKLKRLVLPDYNLVTAFSFPDLGNMRYFKRVNSDLGVKKIHSDYYLEVLHEGTISLYKLYLKSELPLHTPELPLIKEFTDEERYYIFMNGRYEIANLNKVYLKKRFPQYKKNISQFARNNKLKFKYERDFAREIAYIGQLEEMSK